MRLTLHDIIKHLLSEQVSSDEVLDAIHGQYHVRIKYDDGMEDNGGNSKGSRVIQPFAVGTTKKGYPVVRAFQINGNSRRGAPKWKFFRLDRITSWKPMRNKKFFTAPNSSFGEYNKTGDRTMGDFIDNVKFPDMSDTLNQVRATRQSAASAPKVSTKNATGPIAANQQWKKNVFTSQPNSKKYANIAKNVNQTGEKENDYWADYERAKQQANMQNQAPKPQEPKTGPISYDENDYDVNDVDYNENNFLRNTNKR